MSELTLNSRSALLLIAVHEFPVSFWQHANPDAAIDILVGRLRNLSYGWEVRRYAAIALGKIDENQSASDVVSVLAESLSRSLRDWSVRKEAASALGLIGSSNLEEALRALGIAFTDIDSRVSAAATDAVKELAKGSHTRVVSFLVNLLADNDPVRAKAATEVLGALKATSAIRPLSDILVGGANRSATVRIAAARALGQIGPEEISIVRPVLLDVLNDAVTSGELQKAIVLALADLAASGDASAQSTIIGILRGTAAADGLRETAARALGVAGNEATQEAILELLSSLAQDQEFYLRAAAARALGEIGTPAVASIPALVTVLEAGNDRDKLIVLRMAAAEALGNIAVGPRTDVVDVLLASFSDPSRELRRAAEASLTHIGTHAPMAIFDILLSVLKAPSTTRQRNSAALVLGQMTTRPPDAVLDALVAAVHDTSGFDARQTATLTLGRIGHAAPAKSVPALLYALNQPNLPVRRAAARAFAQFGTSTPDDAVPDLIDALRISKVGESNNAAGSRNESDVKMVKDIVIQQAAARALGRVERPSPEVIVALVEAVEAGTTTELRREAALSLGTVGADARERVVPTLVAILNGNDAPWLVREAAGTSLERLLHLPTPVNTQTLLGVLDRTHDNLADRVRLRVWARLLSSHSEKQRNLVALLGNPDDRFTNTPAPKSKELRSKLEMLHAEFDALEDFPRLQREAAQAVVDIVGHDNWSAGGRDLLIKVKDSFSEHEFIAVNAVLNNEINKTIPQLVVRMGLLVIGAHVSLWLFLVLVYPYSRPVQALFFWNKWVRWIGGFGYVSLVLGWVPFLRHRLFLPFRVPLLADLHLDGFDSDSYFKQSRVRRGKSGKPESLLDALPSIKGQMVLEGESGLGKTMFLRYLLSHSRRVVVYLPATKCDEGVLSAIQSKLKGLARDEAFLKRLVKAGAIDVIVDGLNEVSPRIHNLVVSFADEHFAGNLLLSTQPMEWKSPAGAETFVLEPLSQEQIEEFLVSRATTLPVDATVSGQAYHAACKGYVAKNLQAADTEQHIAILRAMSNPMDLTVIADMIARAEEPNLLDLRKQQYEIMAEDYRHRNNGHVFPLKAFSERTFELRLTDQSHFDVDEFPNQLRRMFDYRMVVSRPDSVTDAAVFEFRHDKIMDFFLYQSFVQDHQHRQAKYLQDSRFRGVYLLLATHLPYQDAMALRETLITRAAETKDHSLSDEFIQVIRARTLATVLFSDLVDSTSFQARIGDSAWGDLMNYHDEICRSEVARRGGKLVKFTGDGILATFNSPTSALDCASSVREALLPLDLEVRFGVHTGEIEIRGDDISGLGVTVAARIMGYAHGGQVLASDLTRQLMLGSLYRFAEFGEHELKGVPDRWHLYDVSSV